jgi:hypothetical protein
MMSVQTFGIKDITESTGIGRYQLRQEMKNLPEPDNFTCHGPRWCESKFKEIVIKIGNAYSLVSPGELATHLGISPKSVSNIIAKGAIEKPSIAFGQRKYYRRSDIERIVRQYRTPRKRIPRSTSFVFPPGFYSARSLMKEVGCSTTTWLHHKSRGRIPSPHHFYRGHYCYNEKQKAEIIGILSPALQHNHKLVDERQKQGWYAKKDISAAMGVSIIKVKKLIDTGEIPAPTHRVRQTYFYTRKEFEAVLEELKQ